MFHAQDLTKFVSLTLDIPGGGWVQLVNVNGTDLDIDRIARTQFQDDSRMPNEVDALLSYLMRHRHTSPFEFVQMTFAIRAPIFVKNQIFRHRTAHVNEVSGRYKDVSLLGGYCPPKTHARRTSPTRKQGSMSQEVSSYEDIKRAWGELYEHSQQVYSTLTTEHDLAKETARGTLLMSNFTEFYYQQDLHNLLHFLRLRTSADAQFQTEEYARAMEHFVAVAFPITYRHFLNHIKHALTFSGDELTALVADPKILERLRHRMSSGRFKEFEEKLKKLDVCKKEHPDIVY